jgi:alginate O-acetyltransferase complex protein AlgI
VAWGALHGAYVAVNHLWRSYGLRLPRYVAWPLTFIGVLVGWVLFRAPSFERAQIVFTGMAGLSGFAWNPTFYSIGQHQVKRLLLGLAIVLWCPNRKTILSWEWRNDYAYAAVFALLAGLSILRLGDPSPFLYFQF